jgi:hypothetical protein
VSVRVQQGDLAVPEDTILHPRGATRMFGFDPEWWNGALLVALAVAALAAIAVGVTSAVVMKLQKQATIEFARYKLQTAKEIAEANGRADEAESKLAEYRKPRGPIIQEHARNLWMG